MHAILQDPIGNLKPAHKIKEVKDIPKGMPYLTSFKWLLINNFNNIKAFRYIKK